MTHTNPKLMNKVIFRDPMEKSGEEIKETFFTIKNKKKVRGQVEGTTGTKALEQKRI